MGQQGATARQVGQRGLARENHRAGLRIVMGDAGKGASKAGNHVMRQEVGFMGQPRQPRIKIKQAQMIAAFKIADDGQTPVRNPRAAGIGGIRQAQHLAAVGAVQIHQPKLRGPCPAVMPVPQDLAIVRRQVRPDIERRVRAGKAGPRAAVQVLRPDPAAVGDLTRGIVEIGGKDHGAAIAGQAAAIKIVAILRRGQLGQGIAGSVQQQQMVMFIGVARLGQNQALAVRRDVAQGKVIGGKGQPLRRLAGVGGDGVKLVHLGQASTGEKGPSAVGRGAKTGEVRQGGPVVGKVGSKVGHGSISTKWQAA